MCGGGGGGGGGDAGQWWWHHQWHWAQPPHVSWCSAALQHSHTHTTITFTLTLTWPLCGDHPRTLSPCHLSLPPVLLWCTHLLCHHHLLLVRVTTVCCPADAEQRTSPCPLYRPLYSHGTLLYSTHHCTEPRARAARAPCRWFLALQVCQDHWDLPLCLVCGNYGAALQPGPSTATHHNWLGMNAGAGVGWCWCHYEEQALYFYHGRDMWRTIK